MTDCQCACCRSLTDSGQQIHHDYLAVDDLDKIEHILASGPGTLDSSVAGEDENYTWHGREDADWSVEGIEKVENVEEDRLIFYPKGELFRCEIGASAEEENVGPVWCTSL